jgi:hypothetical protein
MEAPEVAGEHQSFLNLKYLPLGIKRDQLLTQEQGLRVRKDHHVTQAALRTPDKQVGHACPVFHDLNAAVRSGAPAIGPLVGIEENRFTLHG